MFRLFGKNKFGSRRQVNYYIDFLINQTEQQNDRQRNNKHTLNNLLDKQWDTRHYSDEKKEINFANKASFVNY